jgi:hypothetical protein
LLVGLTHGSAVAQSDDCAPADIQVSPWEGTASQLFEALNSQCLPIGEHEIRGPDQVSIFAGTPRAYLSRATFHDLRIGKTLADGFQAGGAIEVFTSPSAAIQEASYLGVAPPWASSGPGVLGWGCTAGNSILLLSSDLDQPAASEYCDTFFKVAPQDQPVSG